MHRTFSSDNLYIFSTEALRFLIVGFFFLDEFDFLLNYGTYFTWPLSTVLVNHVEAYPYCTQRSSKKERK